jgi:hypothetical protein
VPDHFRLGAEALADRDRHVTLAVDAGKKKDCCTHGVPLPKRGGEVKQSTETCSGKQKGRLLFVNKKKQKTLLCWAMGVVADNVHGPAEQKFLRRFF